MKHYSPSSSSVGGSSTGVLLNCALTKEALLDTKTPGSPCGDRLILSSLSVTPSPDSRLSSQNEIKLSQYADYTTLILDGSQETLEASLDVIEKFSKISGLRLNNKKTEALWIGSKARSSERLCPEKDFKWQEFKIKTLGVWLSIEPELTMMLNFEEKTEKA